MRHFPRTESGSVTFENVSIAVGLKTWLPQISLDLSVLIVFGKWDLATRMVALRAKSLRNPGTNFREIVDGEKYQLVKSALGPQNHI